MLSVRQHSKQKNLGLLCITTKPTVPRHCLTHNPSTSNSAERRKLGVCWAQAGYDPLGDHVPETPNFYYSELNNDLIDRLLDNAKCVGVHNAGYFDAFEAA